MPTRATMVAVETGPSFEDIWTVIMALLQKSGSVDLVSIYDRIIAEFGPRAVPRVSEVIGAFVRRGVASIETDVFRDESRPLCCLQLCAGTACAPPA